MFPTFSSIPNAKLVTETRTLIVLFCVYQDRTYNLDRKFSENPVNFERVQRKMYFGFLFYVKEFAIKMFHFLVLYIYPFKSETPPCYSPVNNFNSTYSFKSSCIVSVSASDESYKVIGMVFDRVCKFFTL